MDARKIISILLYFVITIILYSLCKSTNNINSEILVDSWELNESSFGEINYNGKKKSIKLIAIDKSKALIKMRENDSKLKEILFIELIDNSKKVKILDKIKFIVDPDKRQLLNFPIHDNWCEYSKKDPGNIKYHIVLFKKPENPHKPKTKPLKVWTVNKLSDKFIEVDPSFANCDDWIGTD